MLSSIQNNNITFTGKSYSKKALKECEELVTYTYKRLKEGPIRCNGLYAAAEIRNTKLNKSAFGYKGPNSRPLKEYTGSLSKEIGYSTEAGGYGGAWLKASTDTPLSTKDVHTCAILHLVNKNTNEQMLYHVYAGQKNNEQTPVRSIKNLINAEFPRFTHVNIMPGDQMLTNSTVNNINHAVDELNPKAIKQYYHMPVENPEVIAINGELQFIENVFPNKMTFKEITDQYNY